MYIEAAALPSLHPTSLYTSSNRNFYFKCGTVKKCVKHNCCTRGGAWFKKRGDVGDEQFDHTWTEGIQACKGYASLISVKSKAQGMDPLLNISLSRDIAKSIRPHSKLNAATSNSEDVFGVSKVPVDICLLLLISCL